MAANLGCPIIVDKLKQLEAIEKDIANALHSAGQAVTELGKEKPSGKQVELHTTAFLKTLENVESGLSKHITYLTQVSTAQPHEGSSYASQKVMNMALHRWEHARSKLNELERLKNQHLQQNARHQILRSTMPPAPAQQPPTRVTSA